MLCSVVANTLQDKYRVQSVERALDLLDILATDTEGMTVSDIARQLGTSKSTAFALLQTLLARRFVADSGTGSSRRYRLGLGLARLGDHAVAGISLREVATPVLRALTDTTGATSRVAVLDGAYAVALNRIDAPQAVRFDLRMGERELPHCSGVGKALLSAVPEARVREIIAQVGLPQRTRQTITDLDTLLNHLAQAADNGYTIDDEEDADGIFCVGSPVFDHTGTCAGAISVTALKLSQPAWRMHELGRVVLEHADRVSAMLGGPSHAERRAAKLKK
jgi:IclR family transcriptional regulator, acetate operon repressor